MTRNTSERVALVDMDGTTADFNGQLDRDLETMRGPTEEPCGTQHDNLPHIEARAKSIKRQPGWWRNLPVLQDGMHIVELLRQEGYRLMVLTKGPTTTTSAWTEKVDWCRQYLPDAQVSIVEDKGLVFGKVLVDDWPAYAERWLAWRPRGLVIMPDRPWNQGFEHEQVFRYRGEQDDVALLQTLRWREGFAQGE